MMGGSAGRGNHTPNAEFNIYVDPEAASMVFASGIPIVMCGLERHQPGYAHRRDDRQLTHAEPHRGHAA
ncbi:Non-specific ribonucleoside hydrolase rihC [Serratia fonticola]|uniref:Non-specific ribonucleoside hydrolase rihC n=1 Tax=Serratia fonticola TaxID=47917 RepID=A0A4U9TJ56_SERFO|nr:Non-specific ribonucleoside hydrolase rihC [Serratia fonticola]